MNERKDWMVFSFKKQFVPVVRDVAAERIAIGMQQGNPIPDSLHYIANLPDDRPRLKMRGLKQVGMLIETFEDYAADADRAVTNLKMSLPPEEAGPAAETREQRAKVVEGIASLLREQYDEQQLIGDTIDIPTDWFDNPGYK